MYLTTKKLIVAGLSALVAALVAAGAWAGDNGDPFDPVWATMTQDAGGNSPGCRGCHIGPQPGFGRYFGNTKEEVLDYFTQGDGVYLVMDGRSGRLAQSLGLVDGLPAYMPRGAPLDGRFWADDPDLGLTELTDLGNWLDSLGL